MDDSLGQAPPPEDPVDGASPRPGDYSAPGLPRDEGVAVETRDEEAAAASLLPEIETPELPREPVVVGAVQPSPGEGLPEGGPPPPPPPPPLKPFKMKRGGGRGRTFLALIAAAIIGALLALLVVPAVFGVNPYDLVRGNVKTSRSQQGKTNGKTASGTSPTRGATDVTRVARAVTPSVVNIDVRTAPQPTPFSTGQSQKGVGSGVIYTASGYIITNNHVVANAKDITVTLASGEELKAKKVGADAENDIAVVKVDKSGLPAIEVGDSDTLVVGQLVVAVGSPLGFEQTVTAGIISALHRATGATSQSGQASILTDLIQTDASINPGNSGGALCDGSAKLIGINAMIATQSGGSQGIGFAIPMNTAKMVADDLIAGRPVSHPYLGVQGQTISDSIASKYSLPISEGAYVTRVVPGSPADNAGIKAGDIIVAVNSKPVKTMDDVIAGVRSHAVGDKVTITYYSGTSKKKATVTLQEKPTTIPNQ
jgi:S1-C subfamily serine protease